MECLKGWCDKTCPQKYFPKPEGEVSENSRPEARWKVLKHAQARDDSSLCSKSGCGDGEAGSERWLCGGEAGGCHSHLKALTPPTLTGAASPQEMPLDRGRWPRAALGSLGPGLRFPSAQLPTSPQRLVQSCLLSRRSVTQGSRRKAVSETLAGFLSSGHLRWKEASFQSLGVTITQS